MNESNSEKPKKGLSCSAQLLIIFTVIAAVIMSFVSYINSSYVKGLIRGADDPSSHKFAYEQAIENKRPKLAEEALGAWAKDMETYSVTDAAELYRRLGTKEAEERAVYLEGFAGPEGKYYNKNGDFEYVLVGLRGGEPYYTVTVSKMVYPYVYQYVPLGSEFIDDYIDSSFKVTYSLDTETGILSYDGTYYPGSYIQRYSGHKISEKSEEYLNGEYLNRPDDFYYAEGVQINPMQKKERETEKETFSDYEKDIPRKSKARKNSNDYDDEYAEFYEEYGEDDEEAFEYYEEYGDDWEDYYY